MKNDTEKARKGPDWRHSIFTITRGENKKDGEKECVLLQELGMAELCLYVALIAKAKQRFVKENGKEIPSIDSAEITISNAALMKFSRIGSNRTLQKAKNKLIQLNVIKIIKNGKPTGYAIDFILRISSNIGNTDRQREKI